MKTMTELPMDTRGQEGGCGGPPVYVDTPCPRCGETGRKVKPGTVRRLLHGEHKPAARAGAYGLCLTPDCGVAWYATEDNHHFTTAQTDTRIYTKADADPVMACYCSEITRDMVFDAVRDHGLRDMVAIITHYRGEVKSKCAARNPEGRCCTEGFNAMIREALQAFGPAVDAPAEGT